MSGETNESSVREQRVNAAIAAYLAAVDTGQSPDPKDFIAAHSDIAADLEAFFANRDEFERLAKPLHPSGAFAPNASAEDATLPPTNEPTEAPTIGLAESPGAVIGTMVRYFGDYELLEEIARGGMGVVYKARQASLNRIVALKMILAGQLASEEDVRRFHAEAEAAANLDHPGIVPIYEVGQHEGQHYFSMGFVDGSSLAAKVAGGPLPPKEAAEYTKKVAEAVAFAHEHGVIHRDLKPANVLLDGNGEPKVTDFGLAKKVEGESGLTATGQILGTPSYMPPEQASGRIGEVTETADVYSLGAILYCLLTARPPFQADNPPDTLMQVLEREPVSPRTLHAKVPHDLETICLKCLEKDRHRRYASAQDLADELRRFANGEPILARPISGPARAWRWCRRKPVLAGLTASLVLVFLGGFAGVMSQWIRAEGEKSRAEGEKTRAEAHAAEEAEARTRADKEAERANLAAAAERAARGELRRQLYIAHMNLAQQAFEFHNRPVVLKLLNRHRPQSDQEDLRGFEWYYLWRLCHGFHVQGTFKKTEFGTLKKDGFSHLSWYDLTGQVNIDDKDRLSSHQFVRFSPDGKTIAALYGKQFKVFDVGTGKLKATWDAQHTNHISSAAFSPDGRTLASGSGSHDRTVKVWDVATGDLKGTIENDDPSNSNVVFVLFSPTGRTLASGSHYQIKLWDVDTAQTTATITEGSNVIAVAFSPDGSVLATGGLGQQVNLWEVSSGALKTKLSGTTGEVRALAFSPDGHTLAAGLWPVTFKEEDCRIALWDVSTGSVTRSLKGSALFLAFWPNGRFLASASNDTIAIWSVQTGETLDTFLAGGPIAFSPAGDQLASRDGDSVKVWDTAVLARNRDVLKHGTGDGKRVQCIAFSPDGKTLATGTIDHRIRLWNVDTGDLVSTLPGPDENRLSPAYEFSLAFSPDGKTLACGSWGIRLWDVASGEVKLTISNRGYAPVAFSPDGRTLASTVESTIKLWDVATGDVLPNSFLADMSMIRNSREWRFESYPPTLGGASSLAFSPDGKTLAGCVKTMRVRSVEPGITNLVIQKIVLWDVATGNPKTVLPEESSGYTLAFSPDGKLLAANNQVERRSAIQIWDVDAAKLHGDFTGPARARLLALSPDGKTLATASLDGTVTLWDVALSEPKATFKVQNMGVSAIAFSPRGNILALAGMTLPSVDSPGSHGTIRLWRAATDEEVQAEIHER